MDKMCNMNVLDLNAVYLKYISGMADLYLDDTRDKRKPASGIVLDWLLSFSVKWFGDQSSYSNLCLFVWLCR